MEVLSEKLQYSVRELSPPEFSAFCWEVHEAMKGYLIKYFTKVVNSGAGSLFGILDSNGLCRGRVSCEIHSGYTTRRRPCATFGWLDGNDEIVIQELLDYVSNWAAQQQVKYRGKTQRNSLLRGPISFPKGIGGLGCQIEGFDLPRMHSVATNRPELARWIEHAGFKPDAQYACVDVSAAPGWDSAAINDGYRLSYWDRDEWLARETEVLNNASEAFAGILPDSTTGTERFREIIDTMYYHPDSRYMHPVVCNPGGEIVGTIMCTPNLYEAWDGQPVTSANVDTVFISPQHQGAGLFSALNNVGRVNTLKFLGWTHVEGTSIWLANENAVKSIFPHGHICRRHVVFQKRFKKQG
jgi:hypothetical protein